MLYQVLSDLGEVNSFYSRFFWGGSKSLPVSFESSKELACYRVVSIYYLKINKNNDKNILIDVGLNMNGKKIKEKFCLGITPTNNEIKDIIKEVKPLHNRGILLKGTTRKITSQEGGFLNFLRSLMADGLPLKKRALMMIAKNILIPLGLSAGLPAADAANQKKIYGSGTTALIISNEQNRRYTENS